MKRYLVFTYLDYYPAGGWGDFKGDADTLIEAREIGANQSDRENVDVVDTLTGEIVE